MVPVQDQRSRSLVSRLSSSLHTTGDLHLGFAKHHHHDARRRELPRSSRFRRWLKGQDPNAYQRGVQSDFECDEIPLVLDDADKDEWDNQTITSKSFRSLSSLGESMGNSQDEFDSDSDSDCESWGNESEGPADEPGDDGPPNAMTPACLTPTKGSCIEPKGLLPPGKTPQNEKAAILGIDILFADERSNSEGSKASGERNQGPKALLPPGETPKSVKASILDIDIQLDGKTPNDPEVHPDEMHEDDHLEHHPAVRRRKSRAVEESRSRPKWMTVKTRECHSTPSPTNSDHVASKMDSDSSNADRRAFSRQNSRRSVGSRSCRHGTSTSVDHVAGENDLDPSNAVRPALHRQSSLRSIGSRSRRHRLTCSRQNSARSLSLLHGDRPAVTPIEPGVSQLDTMDPKDGPNHDLLDQSLYARPTIRRLASARSMDGSRYRKLQVHTSNLEDSHSSADE